MNYKKLMATTAITFVVGMSGAFAEESGPTLSLSAYLSGEARINQDGQNATEGLVGIELEVTNKFKANLAAQLQHLADAAEAGSLSDAEWDEVISEANIQFDVSLGKVIAEIQIGKRDRSPRLQQVLSKLERAVDSSIMPHDQRGIVGIWVDVPTEMLGDLEFAITETEGGDMKFNSDQIQMTAKFKKAISDSLTIVGSVGLENNSMGDNGYAVSGGVQYDVTDQLSTYGSITHFDNFGGILGSETGFEIGLDYDASDNTTVGGSYENFNGEDKVYVGASHTFDNGMVASGGVFVRNVGKDSQDAGLEAMLRIPLSKRRLR